MLVTLARPLALLLVFLAAPAVASLEEAHAEEGRGDAAAKLEAAEILAGLKSKDPSDRVEAAQAAKAIQHDALTSPLTRLLSDKERGVREAAIDALGARTEKAARKKASSALAARLSRLSKHVADQDELLQVITALGPLGQGAAIKPLMDDITVEVELEIVQARLFAVAQIPDKKAIDALIKFLAKGRRGGRGKHRDLADKALRYATGAQPHKENRKSGRDADRWRAWWRENEKTFSFDAVQEARDEAEEATRAKKERKKKAREKKARNKKDKRDKKQGSKRKKKQKTDGGDA